MIHVDEYLIFLKKVKDAVKSTIQDNSLPKITSKTFKKEQKELLEIKYVTVCEKLKGLFTQQISHDKVINNEL